MTRTPVTIADLARELGLSLGTVSNALSDKGRVSERTRARVLEAAARLGYRRNTSAASLRTGRHELVSVHLPRDVSDLTYYMEFTFGLSAALAEHGIDLLLVTDRDDAGYVARPVDAAVVVDWTPHLQAPRQLLADGVPVLAADGVPDASITPTLAACVDYRELTRAMVARALASGAHRPVLVAPDHRDNTWWQFEITAGFDAACAEAGVEGHRTVFPVGGSLEALVALIDELAATVEPDCLVFGGQRLAGMAAATRRYGEPDSAVPWLASCAGDPISELPSPFITAIDGDPRGFGRRCGELVAELLGGSGAPEPSTVWPARISWAEHWAAESA